MSPYRRSSRACSASRASTCAPTGASPRPRTCAAGSSACRSTRSRPTSGSEESCRTSMASGPREIGWRRGGVEEPGRGERAPIDLGPGIDLRQIPDDKTLSGMLEHGEIDGYIGARAPSCFLRARPTWAGCTATTTSRPKSLFPPQRDLSDHAHGGHPEITRGRASLAAGQRLQGLHQGEGAGRARSRRDLPSGRDAALDGASPGRGEGR